MLTQARVCGVRLRGMKLTPGVAVDQIVFWIPGTVPAHVHLGYIIALYACTCPSLSMLHTCFNIAQ